MKNKTFSAFFFLLFSIPVLLAAATAGEYRDMGMALFQKGLYSKALDYFKKAVQTDPNDWQSYQDMGNTYMKMNDSASALDAYQKSLQINPDNSTLQALVDNLRSTGISSPSQAQDNSNYNSLSEDHPAVSPPADGTQWEESQPTTVIRKTVVVEEHRPYVKPQPVYNDGLAPMDHAKVWTRFEIGYNNAMQGDLINGANIYGGQITQYGWSGSVKAAKDGFMLGAELGFLLNPNNGLALGLRVLRTVDYIANVNFQPGTTNPDFQDETLSPYALPLTLDYYLFLPDGGGRFFLTAGVGYYFGDVQVADNFSFVKAGGSADNIIGDLYGGAVGFQGGIGRDFALSPTVSLSIFGRARYAKITNFRGTLYGNNGSNIFGLAKLSDRTIDIDNAGNIGGNGESYATIDFTGIDVGFALNFYSF